MPPHPAPDTITDYPSIDWSNVFYNDAEFIEEPILATVPITYADNSEPNIASRCQFKKGSCQWTPKNKMYTQEVLPIAAGFEDGQKLLGQWRGMY